MLISVSFYIKKKHQTHTHTHTRHEGSPNIWNLGAFFCLKSTHSFPPAYQLCSFKKYVYNKSRFVICKGTTNTHYFQTGQTSGEIANRLTCGLCLIVWRRPKSPAEKSQIRRFAGLRICRNEKTAQISQQIFKYSIVHLYIRTGRMKRGDLKVKLN